MLKTGLSVAQWLQIPMPIRLRMIGEFGLRRTNGAEVVDGRVVNDGYSESEINEKITMSKMQAFVESKETDFITLVNAVIAKITEELAKKEEEMTLKRQEEDAVLQEQLTQKAVETVAQLGDMVKGIKQRGRPKKVTE
jgi:hypothetical protein